MKLRLLANIDLKLVNISVCGVCVCAYMYTESITTMANYYNILKQTKWNSRSLPIFTQPPDIDLESEKGCFKEKKKRKGRRNQCTYIN